LLVDTFTAKGMNVYARDMYGHGLSEGTRFYIPSWKDMVTDLVNFVQLVARENPTDIPIFLCGESLGGTLTILVSRYFQDHPTESPTNFDSSLLICPAIEADLPPFPVYQILRYVLAPLYPKWRPFFMPNTISPERIWKDPTVCEGYTTARRQEMQLDGVGRTFRLGTAVSMLLCLDEITTHSIPGYKFPFCIVHGDEDMGIPLSGTHYFYQNVDTLEKEKEVHVIPTAYHGLLADPKAEVAIDHLTKFVDGRVKAFVPTPSSKTS
jgi:acylglycerol lipase